MRMLLGAFGVLGRSSVLRGYYGTCSKLRQIICTSDIRPVYLAELKGGGLTPRQLVVVLITVADNAGLSQTGIVQRTGVDRATLPDIVRRLPMLIRCT